MKAFRVLQPDSDNNGAVHVDYQGNVVIGLKGDSWGSCADIGHNTRVELRLGDIKIDGPELHKKRYLLTIEELPSMDESREHPSDFSRRIIQEQEEKMLREAGVSNSVTRRLKSVS